MRWHLLSTSTVALTLITLVLVVSCGEDDLDGPTHTNPNPTPNPTPNLNPAAAFDLACSLLQCRFVDASTDDNGVTAWRWDFGDGSDPATEQNLVHTYATESQYRVR